jgi:uncharacterized protein YjeT (DUF2065 family)
MALKNMIKVGDKVTFGRSGEKKQSGKVVKLNQKTARIKVARCGEFLVSYNLIQKRTKRSVSSSPQAKKLARTRPMATGKKKATGKPICAVPVKGPRAKKNPPTTKAQWAKAIRVITPAWAKKQTTANLDDLGAALTNFVNESSADIDDALYERIVKKLDIIRAVLDDRFDLGTTGGSKPKLNPPRKRKPGARHAQETRKRRAEILGIDTSLPGWQKEYALLARKHIIRRRHRETTPAPARKGGYYGIGADYGIGVDEGLEGAAGITASPKKQNPAAAFTKKGERLYKAIKSGYGRDPRAKEIAARTVYKMAQTKPGLVRKSAKLNPPPYIYGQELKKAQVKAGDDWGEDTLGFATTAPDIYEEEETGKWRRGQTRENPPRTEAESRVEIRKMRRMGLSDSKIRQLLKKHGAPIPSEFQRQNPPRGRYQAMIGNWVKGADHANYKSAGFADSVTGAHKLTRKKTKYGAGWVLDTKHNRPVSFLDELGGDAGCTLGTKPLTYRRTHGALGATDEEKRRRYGGMGIAASGVVLYYLVHKNYLVAGLYSAIAAGYFASSADYKPALPSPLPALGVTRDQQKLLIDIPAEELEKIPAEQRLQLVLRRQEVKAAESASRWSAISTAVIVAVPIA